MCDDCKIDVNTPMPISKHQRQNEVVSNSPCRLIWDHMNYSHAYDALFTVLYNIWIENPMTWSHRFGDISDNMNLLSNHYMQFTADEITLERAWDEVRTRLQESYPNEFFTGPQNTSIDSICHRLITDQKCGRSFLHCSVYGHRGAQFQYCGEYIQLLYTGQFHNDSLDMGYVSQTLGWQLTEHQ